LELGETDFQREVLDALAGHFPAVKTYRKQYDGALAVRRQLAALQERKAQFTKEFDYHQFQFTELDEAGFSDHELEDLELELKLQTNAEGIKTALTKAYYSLEEGEEPVVRGLKSLCNGLHPYKDLHADLPALVQRLESVYIELQDIADETERINGHISADAAAIDRINERLSLGYKLLKKHGVKTTAELLSVKASLGDRLQAVLNIDDEIETLEKEYAALLTRAEESAASISAARKKQVSPLETKVARMLAQVGMPNARLKISVEKAPLSVHGADGIEFLFDANKSNQFQPLRKVASGGELSRLMLCIKSLVATSMNLPTLIFDEIDTGISGEAAKQVGIILKDLAAARQVICITHQPQIAGKGDKHFLVYKAVKNDAVTTGVRPLNTDERIVAIAKMLSGERPTAAALENAREMVMN
jgi:DNA repair protein RecN (Recombination protein N)